MTDLEQRAELAVRLLSPISVYNPSDTRTITGKQMDLLRELLQGQQSEINKLRKRVNEFEARVKQLKEEVKESFTPFGLEASYYNGLDFALSIMTEGDSNEK